MTKVSLIWAGNVGSACADYLVTQSIGDEIVILDIQEGLAEGKALDIAQKAHLINSETKIRGITHDYTATANSNVVVITSWARRQAGQSREDILGINANIIKIVTENILKYSPNAIIIMVSNPLDIMCWHAWNINNIDHTHIIGMAGLLDTARFKTLVAQKLDVPAHTVHALLLWGHGDTMVPLPRLSTVNGKPLIELLDASTLNQIIQRTRDGGAEFTQLMGTSAYFCPGTAAALMVAAIVEDQQVMYPCSVYANGWYGLEDLYIWLPAVLGKNGLEEIIELELTDEELLALHQSAKYIQDTISML